MAPTVRDVMTPHPVTMSEAAPALDGARKMKEQDIGDVIVVDGDRICGVVTDRDIVVRVVADGRDPSKTRLGEVCSRQLVTVSPDDDLVRAGKLMRERAVRRMPVVESGKAVGIVSIGDLAVERDPDSPLADISAASPNR